MEFRQLGLTDLNVSTICLGTMQFGWTADQYRSFEIMDEAVRLGCNFFDTADIYSSWYSGNKGGESETIIGSWLAKRSVSRDQLVIATKVRGKMGEGSDNRGLSRQHISKAIEDSLTRLQTDYIDLYQVHWPDDAVPIEETLKALDDLIKQGKTRYIGCSNYSAQLLAESLEISAMNDLARFDVLQPHYSFVHRAEYERELMPLCANQKIGVIPYSPLGGGFLTGKYRKNSSLPNSARSGGVKERYMNESGWQALEKLEIIGSKHKASVAQTAIAWVLANDTVSSAIIGANSRSQLRDTIAGSSILLDAEDKAVLDEVTAWQ